VLARAVTSIMPAMQNADEGQADIARDDDLEQVKPPATLHADTERSKPLSGPPRRCQLTIWEPPVSWCMGQ
jgi:hypothetical protein